MSSSKTAGIATALADTLACLVYLGSGAKAIKMSGTISSKTSDSYISHSLEFRRAPPIYVRL